MMACSYLSAGGLKSEPTSAACWSPPAMTGCLAETRQMPTALPTLAVTLPTPNIPLPGGPTGLQNGPIGPTGSIGLPRPSMALPRTTIPLPREQLVLSNSVGATQQGLPCSIGLPSTIGLPSSQLGISSRPSGASGVSVLPNLQIGLPPPFTRPMPLDLHSSQPQTGPPTEPALDLSTSAPMPPSLKSHVSPPDEETE